MQYLTSLLVSIGLGLIIGLEREFRLVSQKDRFAGIRTFPLVTILGSIIGLTSHQISPWIAVGGLLGIILFAAATYFVRSSAGHMGITTEVTIIIAFVLGLMCSVGFIKEALAAAVVTTTFLSLKDVFHAFVSRITQDELFAFIKFAIISLLVLPFLPDQGYGPGEILNPWDIGLVIVTISLLSFSSYILMKFAGADKGIILASLLGGLVSSTAVAWVFATKSKKDNTRGLHYAAGIVLASSIMPLRVSVVSLIFVRQLFPQLVIPCALMAVGGFLYALLIVGRNPEKPAAQQLDLGNPINLANAAYSTVLYVAVLLLVYYSKIFLGERGLLISGFVSGIADVDAITIAMSDVVQTTSLLPVYVVILAMISNNLLKVALVLLKAGRQIRMKVAVGLSLITLIGIGSIVGLLLYDRFLS